MGSLWRERTGEEKGERERERENRRNMMAWSDQEDIMQRTLMARIIARRTNT